MHSAKVVKLKEELQATENLKQEPTAACCTAKEFSRKVKEMEKQNDEL